MTERNDADTAGLVAGIEGRRSQAAWVWVLIILGTIVMVISTLNSWVERRLLDTDAWVETSTQLLEDEEVRHELSLRLVNALYENVDVGPSIDEQLPDQLQGLGGPLAGVLRGPCAVEAARSVVEQRRIGDAQRRGDRRVALVSRRADGVARYPGPNSARRATRSSPPP